MRFIQVGVGGFGGHWVNILKENRDVQVVGMVDIKDEALKAACEKAGHQPAICFHSLDEALAKVQTDVVLVCTPPEYHMAPVCQALKAGLAVISEKPMADSLAHCKTMLRTAKQTKRTYVVSQNYRYSAPTWTMNEVVRSGRLGEIGQVKIDFYLGMDFGGGFRHSMDFPLLVDMSIHHFDLIRFVTGLDAVRVRGYAWNPKWSNYKGDCSSTVVFEMSNGARVLYNASWCAKGQFSDWNGNWQIEGTKGTLEYKQGEMKVHDVPGLYKVEKSEPVLLQQPPKGGQQFVLDDFLEAVKARRRPKTDVYDNIRSVAMVFAAVKAVKTGKPTPILDAALKKLLP